MTENAPQVAERGPRADCVVDGDGNLLVEVGLPAAREPALLLSLRGGTGEERLVRLPLAPAERAGEGTEGRLRAVLTATGAHVLAEGRWDVYAQDEPGAVRRRLTPGLNDLRVLLDRHHDPAVSPVAVRIPYPTRSGHLAVRAWLRTAHAEAGEVLVGAESLTVRARLLGARLGAGARVLLRCREQGVPVRELDLTEEGEGAFAFTVGYRELLREEAEATQRWDAFVRPAAGAPPARIGRILDDVADKKHIFTFPGAALEGAARVRPYYTLDNDLAIEVSRMSRTP